MRYTALGNSNLKVSRVCLGTMTWGVQNDQQDAIEQLDYAVEAGVNFIDTAEMYAVPPSADTYGKTETYIGNWLAANESKRDELIIASKIAGINVPWIRGGGPVTGEAVERAVEGSLKRLQTDYLDLYQIHWPNHAQVAMGRHWPNMVKFSEDNTAAAIDGMHDILSGLAKCITAGKIRYAGVSNDSPWGVAKYLQLAREHKLPRITSVQNEFSLLHTKDVPYMLEVCVRENIAYLPWSPLAGGILSGKYLDGARPAGSRWTYDQRMGLFRDVDTVHNATAAYKKIAEKHGCTAAQLALLWCDNVDGVTSTIIGATSMENLREDIAAFELPFTDELSKEMADTLKQHGLPF
ncbi:MAG: aldo/keto reductase [Pseudomonadales bacterium]